MPAKAPATRARARHEEAAAKDIRMKVTWKGRLYRLSQSDLGPGDDLICRQQSGGFTVTGLLSVLGGGRVEQVGGDVLAVLVWMCRRKNGEPNLTLDTVLAEITSNNDLLDGLNVDVEVEDGSPEA